MVQVVHRLGNVLPIPRRRLLFALLTLTLLGAAGAASHYAGRNLWARHHYRAATEALESSDLAAARTHLLLCLEVWSNSAETHLQAARTFRRLEEYEEAENQLQACEQREEVAEAVQMERILTQAQRGDLIGVESYLVAAVQQNHADTPLIVEVLTKAYARASWLMLEEKGARQWTGMIES